MGAADARSMHTRLLALAVANACLALASGGSASARSVASPLSSSRSVATTAMPAPAAAGTIVEHLWTARERALGALDAGAIHSLETASVLQEDTAYVASVRCGCEARKDVHPLLRIVPQVPATSVEGAFVAQVRTANPNGKRPWYLLVVARTGGAWKIAQLTLGGYGAAPPLQAVTRSGGATPSVTAAGQAQIAKLARSAFELGTASLAPVSHTDYGATIHSRAALHAAKDGVYGLALPGGRVLSCFTSHQLDTYTNPAGVLQQGAARTQWDHRLLPGTYASITLDSAVPFCVVGAGVPQRGLAWYYDERVFGISGVRA
jgi:hypothetical protein